MIQEAHKAARKSLFANLPVGRSFDVRAVLIVSALLAAGCVLWIQHLRVATDTGGLSPIFFVLFSVFDYRAAQLALALLLLALFVPRWGGFDRVLRLLGEHPILVGLVVTIILALGTLFIYRNQPLSMDEYAPFFQSRVFATGHLAGKFPLDLLNCLVPVSDQNTFLNVSKSTGEVSSAYWPSFALLLTPFTMLGVPWVCNPVLSGITIIVLNRLALRLFDNVEAAGFVTLLTLASPVFFADGISYYSMTSHMCANALFALLVLEPSFRRLFVAGIVGSIALTLHNPVPHILFAVPWFVWLARRERPFAHLAVLWAGYLPLSIVLGIGWFLHSGELTHSGSPVAANAGTLESLTSAFVLPSWPLLYARLVGLAKVLLWASPCLIVLAVAGARRRRSDSRFAALAACGLLTFVGYLFFWPDQGHGWGFRYFHSAWLVLPLLGTAFLFVPAGESSPAGSADLRAYVVACALLSLFAGVGLRASQIGEFMANHLGQLPRYGGTEPRIVVLTGIGFYPLDLVQNDPFLRDDVVRMIDYGTGACTAAINRHFPSYSAVYRDRFGSVWSAATPSLPTIGK
ncbi:MAG: hypothetical protein ABI769_11890 [Pseudomonadota bacterium]